MFTARFKRLSSLSLFFCLISHSVIVPSYDFFKKPAMRIQEATKALEKSPSDIAYVTLFLEKLRNCYHTHLDRIESALPYWEWAQHHPYRYTASQLPNKWLSHEKNLNEINQIYTMINALRDVYSKEFGIIIRLLAAQHEDNFDDATWLVEFQKAAASLLGIPLEELKTTEQIMQKLSAHEQDVAKMVEKVQKPDWLMRNWRLLLTTAVLAGAATYMYMNNKASVDAFIGTSQSSIKNFGKTQVAKPLYDFKRTLLEATQPIKPVDNQQKNSLINNINNAEDAVKRLNDACDQSNLTGWGMFKQFTQPVFDGLKSIVGVGRDVSVKIDSTLDAANQLIEANRINLALVTTIPVCLAAYGMYKGLVKTYNWFTKHDRRALIGRMCQAEQVLIRTKHKIELDDAEYGRMLYLLMKAYDQVARNVFSDERIAFLNDLTYIADAQSSIEQKQKTLDSMWRKYRSLEKLV